MTKRRKARKPQREHLELVDIMPLTDRQALVMGTEEHGVFHGVAGTGKSFLASFLAFEHVFSSRKYDKIVYIRSSVPTRDMGFLPGTEKEKARVYEEPYVYIAEELFGRGDAYEILKRKGIVDFLTTSYIRGLTFRDSIIIVDECQNMSMHELDSIITRVGEDCIIYFCGDWRQSDLKDNGIKEFFAILKSMGTFNFVDFQIEDIVRSDLVKEYLIQKYEHSDNNK